jgi:hypothetical protein
LNFRYIFACPEKATHTRDRERFHEKSQEAGTKSRKEGRSAEDSTIETRKEIEGGEKGLAGSEGLPHRHAVPRLPRRG